MITQYLTLPVIFGYEIYIERLIDSPTDKLVDFIKDEGELEIWLFGKTHLIISNLNHPRNNTPRLDE